MRSVLLSNQFIPEGETEPVFRTCVVPFNYIQHAEYIKSIVESSEENDILIEVPNAKGPILDFMGYFMNAHQNDDVLGEISPENIPPLTDADKVELQKLNPIQLVDLMKAADYIHAQNMVACACTFVASELVTKNEEEIQKYYGIERTFTEKEIQSVQEKFPALF